MAVNAPTGNYFALFGLPEQFALNEAELHRLYIALQQRYHPDRQIGKSEEERLAAIQFSMDGNDAYEMLKSPLKRAEHLLALQGIIVNSEEGDSLKPSADLLIESMEMREQIAAAKDLHAINHCIENLKHAMQQTQSTLADCFAKSNWLQAAQQTFRLKYQGKALEEALMMHYRLQSLAG